LLEISNFQQKRAVVLLEIALKQFSF